MNVSKKERERALNQNVNCDEGHLGGYVRASPNPAPSGLHIEHGDPATWNPRLWQWVYETLNVRSILDVGCGEGHSAGYFRELGCKVLGIDGSVQAKRDSVIAHAHIIHDYNSGPFIPEGEFDLLWCCEFVEHVAEKYCSHFLATFGCAKNYIMMTYAPPGQPGWQHVNCQPKSYWIEKLETIGFVFYPILTRVTRHFAESGHYHNKGLFFVRKD
ncbi:class I SAM-dependent methyltransferase [candidate division CSSED10-310 bacterium]|uniref:Class I SAM-dependent methyltransferase n=1 Tax=candidate division CSSED10-310 bacterium TaxID=2855610 RepID=A0ABV6YRC4_UNCC1